MQRQGALLSAALVLTVLGCARSTSVADTAALSVRVAGMMKSHGLT